MSTSGTPPTTPTRRGGRRPGSAKAEVPAKAEGPKKKARRIPKRVAPKGSPTVAPKETTASPELPTPPEPDPVEVPEHSETPTNLHIFPVKARISLRKGRSTRKAGYVFKSRGAHKIVEDTETIERFRSDGAFEAIILLWGQKPL